MNPEIDQDRVFDLFEMFNKSNQVMFEQQRVIYEHLACEVGDRYVLEAGCGTGQGTATLSRTARHIIGTDKGRRNIEFARRIYPWLLFGVWDLKDYPPHHAEVVVCVEAVEHVQDGQLAVNNLLSATARTLWISTPNGTGRPVTPDNPFHVREYTPEEMIRMLGANVSVTIRHWRDWTPLKINTDVDPLVYEIHKTDALWSKP